MYEIVGALAEGGVALAVIFKSANRIMRSFEKSLDTAFRIKDRILVESVKRRMQQLSYQLTDMLVSKTDMLEYLEEFLDGRRRSLMLVAHNAISVRMKIDSLRAGLPTSGMLPSSANYEFAAMLADAGAKWKKIGNLLLEEAVAGEGGEEVPAETIAALLDVAQQIRGMINFGQGAVERADKYLAELNKVRKPAKSPPAKPIPQKRSPKSKKTPAED